MIAWINGRIIEFFCQGIKEFIIIETGGIGYEIQLIPRYITKIKDQQTTTLWIHHIQREDGSLLFGFETITEKNLFRKLIAINGVGPQIAIGLLEKFTGEELLIAIAEEDISKLTMAQGVGKKVASRITVELKEKLYDLTKDIPVKSIYNKSEPENNDFIRQELKRTLKSLEYKEDEINAALNYVKSEHPIIKAYLQNSPIDENNQIFDEWLKASLVWLSKDSL